MILGHPGKGEIYGFLHSGSRQSWCALRNPLSYPQILTTGLSAAVDHKVGGVLQFYPHFEALDRKRPLTFLAHEVKLLIFSVNPIKLAFNQPFIVGKNRQGYLYRFPGNLAINETVRPLCEPVQRIEKMACLNFAKKMAGNRQEFDWFLRVPHRIRNCELQGKITGVAGKTVLISAFTSRYQHCINSKYALPITIIPTGVKGHGERRNADVAGDPDTLYFAAALPAGGEFGLTLSLSGVKPRTIGLEAWLTGYQAPSRRGIQRSLAPAGFEKSLPYPHPLGFPTAMPLPGG
jgi:hypothetical protein